MTDDLKRKQLRKYKFLATGLFFLMALIFIGTTIWQKSNDSLWLGYVRSFAEAAMVGALADWFAVTALFHHPLGIKIPHTNLIQKKKEQIGDNLGNFVVENFLSPQNIRPYISKLKISTFLGDWLSKEKNKTLLYKEGASLILDVVNKLDDKLVVRFIANKSKDLIDDLKLHQLFGNGIEYAIEKNHHQKIISGLAKQLKNYILENHELVRERVKKESYSLVPKFVDDAIADKITQGIASYFNEVETDQNHTLRSEISQRLLTLSSDMKENQDWEEEFSTLKTDFLAQEKLAVYASDIWMSVKKVAMKELGEENSAFKRYLMKNLDEWAQNLKQDEALQHKIDHWVRVTAYKYILKNTHQFGALISSTVGNWQGKELSNKLELEVGKDLQFIRVNGTLVGGLVGLIIYTITHFFI